ncbi:MAG: sulfatase-like hydrolase/transferase, partial [Rubrobacter sp.]
YVPPGWDEWYGEVEYATLNHNGQVVEYPADTYHDDALSGLAQGFIRRQEGKDGPFFMYLSVSAPHAPADPALRYEEFFEDAKAPRTPSFNEADVSDKPEWARLPSLDASGRRHIDKLYSNRLRTMVPVVETIEGLISTLEETGQLDDTYLVFASDNGYHMGQHRLELGKDTAYEEDIRVPLMVRGPGVPEGTREDDFVLNNDLAPTFADLAGVEPPGSVDGRSFAPMLDGSQGNDPERWRSAFQISHWNQGAWDDSHNDAVTPVPPYRAVRTPNYLYVEYETGERELYNLNADPHQLESLHDSADPALVEKLGSRLETLKDCEGQGCRDAEN